MLIPLSATNRCLHAGKYAALVDDVDADLGELAWYAKISRTGPNELVYACREMLIDGVMAKARMHRIIWERANGPIPDGFVVDHIEHGEFGGLDNRRDNLRLAQHRRNVANGRLRANNSSGFKGVHFRPHINKWQALIRIEGKRKHLGYFADPAVAAQAYDSAAIKAFGEFACLNRAA